MTNNVETLGEQETQGNTDWKASPKQTAAYLIKDVAGIKAMDIPGSQYFTEDGKPIQSGEKMVISSKITSIFKKHRITVYWTGNKNTTDDYTQIDITPKSK
jgi:hypothetical protein